MTDASVFYGTYKTIKYLVNHGVTTYQYFFNYRGQFSFTNLYVNGSIGVCHGDDLIYLWDPVFQHGIAPPTFGPLFNEDALLRNTMTKVWTNFAKYGDPTPPNSNFNSWIPLSPNSEHHFWNIINSGPMMSTSQDLQERMKFWEDIVG